MKDSSIQCRSEIAGLILLAIATVLTIVTLNYWGIVAMFFAGVALCWHKHCTPCDIHQEEDPLLAPKRKATVRRAGSKKVE